MTLNHIQDALALVQRMLYREVDAIYDDSVCTTALGLKVLLETEHAKLLRLQQLGEEEVRRSALRAMAQDGVAYPELVWARHIGLRLPPLKLLSLRSSLPAEDLLPPAPPPAKDKAGLSPILGGTLSAGGIGLSACTILAPPLQPLLLALGLFLTAGGMVLLLRQEDRLRRDWQTAEADQVRQVLLAQRITAKKAISRWLDQLMTLIRASLPNEPLEEKGEGPWS